MSTTVDFSQSSFNITTIVPAYNSATPYWTSTGFSPNTLVIAWTSLDGTTWTQYPTTSTISAGSINMINLSPVNPSGGPSTAFVLPSSVSGYNKNSSGNQTINISWTYGNGILPGDTLQIWGDLNTYSTYLAQTTVGTTLPFSFIVTVPAFYSGAGNLQFIVPGKFTGSQFLASRNPGFGSAGSFGINYANFYIPSEVLYVGWYSINYSNNILLNVCEYGTSGPYTIGTSYSNTGYVGISGISSINSQIVLIQNGGSAVSASVIASQLNQIAPSPSLYLSLQVYNDPVYGDYNDKHTIYSSVTVPSNNATLVTLTSALSQGYYITLHWTIANLLFGDTLQVWSNSNSYSNFLAETTCGSLTMTLYNPFHPYTSGLGLQFIVPGKFTGQKYPDSVIIILPSTASIYTNLITSTANSITVNWQNNGFQSGTPLQVLLSSGNYSWVNSLTTTCGALTSTINGLQPNTTYNVVLSVKGDPNYQNYNDYITLDAITYLDVSNLTSLVNGGTSTADGFSGNNQTYHDYYYTNGNTGIYVKSITIKYSTIQINWLSTNVSSDTPVTITIVSTCYNQSGDEYTITNTYSGVNSDGTITIPNTFLNIPTYNNLISINSYYGSVYTRIPLYFQDIFVNGINTIYTSDLSLQVYTIIPGTDTISVSWNTQTPGFVSSDSVQMWIKQVSPYVQRTLLNTSNYGSGYVRGIIPSQQYPNNNLFQMWMVVPGKYNTNFINSSIINAPVPNSINNYTTSMP
jgi:hypothetical protein